MVSIHTCDSATSTDREPNAKNVALVTSAPLSDMSQSRPISTFEQSEREETKYDIVTESGVRHISLLSLHANAYRGSSVWANSCDVSQTG